MVNITKTLLNKLKKNPSEVLKNLSEDDIAKIIQKANYSYYNTSEPLMSDTLFDIVKEYLENLNPNHPVLKAIGHQVEYGKKEKLPYFLGSLNKIKTDEKLIDKFKKEHTGSYIVSDKLDGNSALLYITNNSMKLFSRGDGIEGQNITHLLPFIQLRFKLEETKSKEKEICIRGELIISKKDFETVKDKFANARNLVAGLVNSKIPDTNIAKLVQFVAYELITPKVEPVRQYAFIECLGFKTAFHVKKAEEQLTANTLSQILVERREVSEFEIDGIVVAHNAIYNRVKGNPSHAFAFKSVSTMQKAEVTVTSVEWNMSKDGYFVPVIIFNPVSLAGVTIRRANGFNGKYIWDNKIGPGSKIIIMRSGDVIPYVTDILSYSETGQPQMPEMKYEWTKSGVDIKVVESSKSESDELKLKNLVYFFEKIDVKGLSKGNIKKIFNAGFKDVKSIFNASIQDLLKVEGFKDKTAEKLVSAIKDKKDNLDCIVVMDASNTLGRGIGYKKIELVLEKFPNIISNRYIPTLSELLSIKGIEKTTAEVLTLNLPKYFEFLDLNNLTCIAPLKESGNISKEFADMKFVFTGFRNDVLEKYITERGGVVSSTVSKSTTAVICKSVDDESTKVKKAESLGIKIMTIEDFQKIYKIVLK
jgi:DNA ligase (NAD+)